MIDLSEEIKCKCKNKIRGYECVDSGFSLTYCSCGGVISAVSISEDNEPFDITKHEFSDTGIECCEFGGGVLTMHNPELTTNLDKQDAIAIAKALGVTGEDLK